MSTSKREAVEAMLIGYGRMYQDKRQIVGADNVCSQPIMARVGQQWICTREPNHAGPHVGHWPGNPDIYVAWDDNGLLQDESR